MTRTMRDRVLEAVLGAFLGAAIIKAASADLTWDEAWTYLHYGRSALGWTALDYANDHPLNSVLVWLATALFGDSEFAIRLPNLAACGLYCVATARLLGRTRLPLAAAALFLLQPYLLDYFACARGYGLAAGLVQWGLVRHYVTGEGERGYGAMLGAFALASLSIFPVAVLLDAAIAVHVATSWRRGVPVRARLSTAFAAASLVPAAGLLWVSRDGVPVFGSHAGVLDAVLRNFAHMYVAAPWERPVGAALLLGALALAWAARRAIGEKTARLLATLLLAGAVVALAAALTGRPLPAGRLLVPWYPPAALATLLMLEDWCEAGHAWGARAASLVMSCLAAASLLTRAPLTAYADWPQDAGLQSGLVRALVARRCIPPALYAREGQLYYVQRWFGPGASFPVCGPE